jgi:hypothetical protein
MVYKSNLFVNEVITDLNAAFILIEPKQAEVKDLIQSAANLGIALHEADSIEFVLASIDLGATPSLIAISIDSLQNKAIRMLCALRARGFVGEIVCFYSKALSKFMQDSLGFYADDILPKSKFYNRILLSNPIYEAA